MPHATATPSITSAVREEISRFHSHHTPMMGSATAKAGLSQKALMSCPCSKASIMRCPPQKGQLRPVSRWKGQGSILKIKD